MLDCELGHIAFDLEGDDPMRNVFALAAAVFILGMTLTLRAQAPVTMNVPAPELQGIETWINSDPLQLKDLKGKVVVLHFWTFG
jgi:hypothetical protein